MSSCTASDDSTQLKPATTLTAAPARRWDEHYCDEVANGRPHCPPGRCRYGGTEHPRVPRSSYEPPFGRRAQGAGGGRSRKPARGRAGTKAGARKAAGRKPAGRKPAKGSRRR